ncbi:hypothetical protein LMG28688_07255 [Paraburkholderia caffeinitolerans]|uniref:Uncharacterized protein n=1 Tax=Paraburkholderia caffeinitolerans TaxID=1723730 RepID=A0A6J5H2B5_9BURK|nr:hypothetical protein LMG28688_07255 [Paraburkholderia caffeinitolerans]
MRMIDQREGLAGLDATQRAPPVCAQPLAPSRLQLHARQMLRILLPGVVIPPGVTGRIGLGVFGGLVGFETLIMFAAYGAVLPAIRLAVASEPWRRITVVIDDHPVQRYRRAP